MSFTSKNTPVVSQHIKDIKVFKIMNINKGFIMRDFKTSFIAFGKLRFCKALGKNMLTISMLKISLGHSQGGMMLSKRDRSHILQAWEMKKQGSVDLHYGVMRKHIFHGSSRIIESRMRIPYGIPQVLRYDIYSQFSKIRILRGEENIKLTKKYINNIVMGCTRKQ